MKFRLTLLLMIAVTVLAGFIFLFERKTESTRRREEKARQAFRVEVGRVTFLRIESGNFLLECALKNNQWQIQQPARVRANQGEIDRILDHFASLPRGELITVDEMKARGLTPADFGLNAPRTKIVLGDDVRRQTFWVGRTTPLSDSVYLKEETRPEILTVSTNLLAFIPSSLESLRDRTLFHGTIDQIRRVDIRGPAGFVQLARNEQGLWAVQQPLAGRADRNVLRGLLDQLLTLRVEGFVSDSVADVAPFGLDGNSMMVVLGGEARETDQVLQIGNPTEKDPGLVYAKLQSENSVYTVSAGILTVLNLKPDDLRDRRLIGLPTYDIGRLRIEEGERFLELAKKQDEGWFVVEPKAWKADDQTVEDLIAQWAQIRIEAFEDSAQADWTALGFVPPARVLRISGRSAADFTAPTATNVEETAVTVSSQALPSGLRRVRVSDEGLIYTVSDKVLTLFPLDPLAYRDPVVLALDSEDVTGIRVQHNGVEQAVEKDASGSFQPVPPTTGPVDEETVKDLLMVLNRLVAAKFIEADPKDLSAYGLNGQASVISLSLKGKTGLGKTLALGNPLPAGSGRYALIKGQDVVFIMDEDSSSKLLRHLCPTTNESQKVSVELNSSTNAAP
jgi:hypothetical protein